MAKVQQSIRLTFNEDGAVLLRHPTVEEYNDFLAAGYPSLRGGRLSAANSVDARVAFFDKLVTGFENIEDDDGQITVETKDRFPVEYKVECIFVAFDQQRHVELVKNSGGTSGTTST